MNKTNLERIKIIGLFGEKDVFITFEEKVRILIAENGAGKTTILNIIIAAISGDTKKLKDLPFGEIKIKIKGVRKEYSIIKNKLYEEEELERKYKALNKKLYFDYKTSKNSKKIKKSKFFNLETQYDLTLDYYKFLKNEESNDFDNLLKKIKNSQFMLIKEMLQKLDFKVIYLPTYRRIEEKMSSFNIEEKSKFQNKKLNFGMGDVENILEKITSKIKDTTVQEYSIMNKAILNDLIFEDIGKLSRKKIKDKNLKIVLSRLEESKDQQDQIFNKIDELIKEKDQFNGIFLKYYLNKIADIYEKQQKEDESIKKFVDICNVYLINKYLEYNEELVEVNILNGNDEKIKLENLSSGEKQIISLFAELLLQDYENLFMIIDEPELSLSIEWQKRLLPDIMNTGKCNLLLATTHSPFVFDNDFDENAHSLSSHLTDSDPNYFSEENNIDSFFFEWGGKN